MDTPFLAAAALLVLMALIVGVALGAVPAGVYLLTTRRRLAAAQARIAAFALAAIAAALMALSPAILLVPPPWPWLVPIIFIGWIVTASEVQLLVRLTGGPGTDNARHVLIRDLGARRVTAIAAVAVVVAGIPFAVVGVRHDLCLGSEWRLVTDASAGSGPVRIGYLGNLLPRHPRALGADASLLEARPANLAEVAASKHDPQTAEQLRSDGFVAAFEVAWELDSGRGASAEVIEFSSVEGAQAYHRSVTRHACQYASRQFGNSQTGLGLEVLYQTGDPVHEQIAWVDGARRFAVARTYLEAPPSFDDIQAFAAAVRAKSRDFENRLAAYAIDWPAIVGPSLTGRDSRKRIE